jgi:CCR4-NOT transcription complex subunit 7/8
MSMKKQVRKDKPNESIIRDVFMDNFREEIKTITKLIETYKYVSFDTEFPGVIFQCHQNTREAYYKSIKQNVDKLKLIQMGITISDEHGNTPQGVNTWQFNLKFDLNSDQYSNESIALLCNSGIDFEKLQSNGIPPEIFGEYMMTSGLLLNEELHWISFHGIYDFAYFIKIVTNLPLPETEFLFFDCLKLYFPYYYDIRHLVRFNDSFRGSLAKLGVELNVSRVGTMHQAGSDSLITSEIFFKLKKEYLSEDACKTDRNILFGIGQGLDEETTYYNSFKVNNTFSYDYPNYYPQNMINMQYNYIRNNPNYFPVNNYNYQYMNQMNMPYNIDEKKRFNIKSIVED